MPGDSEAPKMELQGSQNGAPEIPRAQKGARETLRHPKNGARTLRKGAEMVTLPRSEIRTNRLATMRLT